MNNTNWYEFKEDGYAKRRREPRVSLSHRRYFRFNQKALDLIGSPKAVSFLFDAELKRIGIRPIDPEEAHSFDVRKERGLTSVVSGALFCERVGINPEFTLEFQSVRTDDDGTLLLDLPTARRRLTHYTGGK